MAFADTSRIGLGLVEESTFGEWPGGNLEEIRFSSESFGHAQETTQSNEIRADQQIPDIIRTSISGQGGYEGELSYDVTAWETLVKALLGADSDFSTPPSELSGAIDAVASGNKFESDSTGSGIDMSDLSVGDWIRTSGFSNDANNGYFQITAVDTATASNHNVTVAGASLEDETGGGSETMQGSAALRNDTNEYSFSLEKQFNDLSLAARVLGYKPGGLTLNLNPGEIVTYSWSGQGKQVSDTAGTDISDKSASLDFSTLATLTSAAANSIMSTANGVADVIINRDDPFTSVTLQSLTLNPQRNLREQQALDSSLGPVGIAAGMFSVTGDITAYFEDKSLIQEYLRFSTTDIAVALKDGDGNAYLVDVPAVKLGGDALPKGSGNNSDALVETDMSGFRSTRDSQDYTFAIHKFAA